MSPVGHEVENVLLSVILQLVLIIAAARICGLLFRRFGQPQVCGEIAAGLILGPSVLGRVFPEVTGALFQGVVGPVFSILSQLGLVLLMFLIGLEFDFGHLRRHRTTAVAISITGIVVPFGLGLAVAAVVHPLVAPETNHLGLSLFLATALSITALPVLGRMLVEFNLHHTRLGSLTITAAAFDDVAGWVILAVVSALVRSDFHVGRTAVMIAMIAGYVALTVRVVRPLLVRWSQAVLHRHNGDFPLSALTLMLVAVLLSAAVTNLLGIFSIFGAFLLGAILHDQQELRDAMVQRLRDFVTVFFLPIFFTYTGLRTDIGTMHGAAAWALCGLVIALAIGGKLLGCTLAARVSGFPRREAWAVGVLMNTRGLMELIVINVGYDLGVIPRSVFFMLVLMAIITTYMTTPLLRRALRGSELAPLFEGSAFARSPLQPVATV